VFTFCLLTSEINVLAQFKALMRDFSAIDCCDNHFRLDFNKVVWCGIYSSLVIRNYGFSPLCRFALSLVRPVADSPPLWIYLWFMLSTRCMWQGIMAFSPLCRFASCAWLIRPLACLPSGSFAPSCSPLAHSPGGEPAKGRKCQTPVARPVGIYTEHCA